jgi:hypothetical protein
MERKAAQAPGGFFYCNRVAWRCGKPVQICAELDCEQQISEKSAAESASKAV